ncbi:sensor histidine kinase [Nonomuraea dietziae]|uniref:histidine kinase n=1 Tax=Nonomuraea dietziae TaxID=65515 RepID=A0A7W5UZ68_9ACTN|nr:sensor domain-containing protein [Nonomuraea dietziae]MBB3725714.1 signal transduction histidine kinase [Nonomuraea dietziae]
MDRRALGGFRSWRVPITAPVRGRAGRELAYALLMPLMAGLGLLYLLVVLLGVIATANIVGVPFLALCVVGARGLGAANRGLARALAGEQVAAPAPFRSRPGPLNRLAAALGDVVGWRAVIHGLVRLPAAVLAFAVAAGLWGYGLLLLSCPLWWRTAALPAIAPTTWPDALLLSAAGVALLLLAPWGVRLALVPERWLARTLLGPAPGAARIRTLEQTRALAVDDAAAALRRIERDLHDGTAARLVALAMRLGMAQEELAEADRPERLERARGLVDGAHREAKETLAELRVLTRGIHPPALDKGLEIALETLAARSPIPVALEADLPERPSPAVESIAFFCTAELLANVAKHSGARRAAVELRTRAGLLALLVRDDGKGGAMMDAGSGLRGLADRVRMVDGRLGIRSPAGGPTVVTVELPLHI